MSEYHGHMTHKDGSHTALSKEEDAALWASFEKRDAEMAALMPQAWDALGSIIRAEERLRNLGWRKGGGLAVKKGDECAVIEFGSTGMWSGWLDDERKFVHYSGCASSPQKVWLKPLSELTEEERAHMAYCDKDSAEYMEGEFARWSDEDALRDKEEKR